MLFPGPDHLTDEAHGVIGFGKSAEAAIGPVGVEFVKILFVDFLN